MPGALEASAAEAAASSVREQLLADLAILAEIEHSLMVQYLYAAYSLDVAITVGNFPQAGEWQQQLLTVAREEMGHLMTVQNARRLVGAEPTFHREQFPYDNPFYPFPMAFEPLTREVTAKYVWAEMDPRLDQPPRPANEPPGEADWQLLRQQVYEEAKASVGQRHTPGHVATLFEAVFDLLADPALTDATWFDPTTFGKQASWDAWGKGLRPHPLDSELDHPDQPPHVIVEQMGTRTEALAGLRLIAAQGEAPHFQQPRPPLASHFDRFFRVYYEISRPRVHERLAAVMSRLPTNPTTVRGVADTTYIEHPGSRRLAALSDLRYHLLLVNLGHALRTGASEDPIVRRTNGYLLQRSFADMFNVKTLACELFRAPLKIDSTADGPMAGPPFGLTGSPDLPASDRACWQLQRKLNLASKALCEQLLTATGIEAPPASALPYLRTLRQLDVQDDERISAILAGLPPDGVDE
jgi:hypothetical protein